MANGKRDVGGMLMAPWTRMFITRRFGMVK